MSLIKQVFDCYYSLCSTHTLALVRLEGTIHYSDLFSYFLGSDQLSLGVMKECKRCSFS